MNILGFQTLTLLDYPGKTAATLFLGGCNFRCPFCQNSPLVLHPQQQERIPEDEIFSFLKKRQGILDGVCISGGEPTLDPSLPLLAQKLKSLGYSVKLDTNGTHPETIRTLVSEQLIDYVAMDIKSSKEHYEKAIGRSAFSLDAICDSVEYLKSDAVNYEFRTTVVKELHAPADFEAIADWLDGCRRYYLQAYRDCESVICPGFSSYSKEELESFLQILRKKIPQAKLRGID